MALLCDQCDMWSHCKCSGISKQSYWDYQNLYSFQWLCPRCLSKAMPFYDCSSLVSDSGHSDSRAEPNTSNSDHSVLNIPCNSTSSTIRIAHLNCRSLLSSLSDIHLLILRHDIDILTLSETWLDDTIKDEEICPRNLGFYVFRQASKRWRSGHLNITKSEVLPEI